MEARLRIESAHGAPVNDYRIRDGQVQLRSLDASGHPYPGSFSNWRSLNENDIRFHYVLGTVVSVWLRVRLAVDEKDLSKAA
jgi:hypothetical protein